MTTKKAAPKKAATKPALRKRRTSEEARTAILDAAEQRLVALGPAGIRLQEVAADVGMSHPTVLHHFGSREALVEAVVARAIDSIHSGLLAAMGPPDEDPDHIGKLLDSVSAALIDGGHARAFLWLALSGYASTIDELKIRSFSEAVHEMRKVRRTGKKRMPPFEDTYFTVLLAALSLLSLSVIRDPSENAASDAKVLGPERFRAWLGRLMHEHLERE